MSEYTTEDKDLVFSNNNEVNVAAREIVNYGILNILFREMLLLPRIIMK